MAARNFIVATAGHVDHGKSALVKALTGTDPDRLPEEKARGVTIDLGFANLELSAPLSTLNSQPSTFSIGIIDVPGHEDFVKNMIAGVGSIDLALFVVAVDDGWMPQTEEHLQILTYVGVKHAVVALTKSDLGDATQTAAQVREQLTGSPFARAPIVETSILTGRGIDELKQTLACELSSLSPQRDLGKPRLFIDRAFSLRGVGTVVTGTLVGGKFARGQNVVVQPRNIPTRIRTIQSHNREQQAIGPGTRTALNLPDIATADIARGDIVTVSELGEATSSIDVLLTLSSRAAVEAGVSPARFDDLQPGRLPPQLLKNGVRVYVHHGTTRVAARIAIVDVDLAHITLASPVLAFVGDRFVLRDPSERQTLAGGLVLDVQTNRKKFREPNQREFLIARAQSPNDPVVFVRSELRRDGARDVDLLLQSNFSGQKIAATIESLRKAGEVVVHGDIVADANWWATFRRRVIEAIETHHKQNPQLAGLDLAQLRAESPGISSKIFDALIVDLCQDDYTQIGNFIKRSEHRAVLPQNLAEAAEKIRRLLGEKPFDPPARKQIAPDLPSRQALNFLLEQGELIELSPDLVLSGEALSEMKAAITAFISKNGAATVSQLRQELGTSRRVLVPFLEQLDSQGVTQREGDRRKLRE